VIDGISEIDVAIKSLILSGYETDVN